MERQNEELRDLLREWVAPDAPAALETRVLDSQRPWWRMLLFGYIRIPVPVACALAILIVFGAWRLATVRAANGCSPAMAAAPAPETGVCLHDSRC